MDAITKEEMLEWIDGRLGLVYLGLTQLADCPGYWETYYEDEIEPLESILALIESAPDAKNGGDYPKKENEKTAVRSSHGTSKTFSAAEIAVWFLNCYENSKVITTAPTWTQMKMLLWAEINKTYATSRIELENESMRNSTAKEVICCRCGKETLFYTIAPYGSKDDGDPICAECLDSKPAPPFEPSVTHPNAKWGQQNHGPDGWLAILMEEVGEVARAILEGSSFKYRDELIQVAAVAVAALECLNRGNLELGSLVKAQMELKQARKKGIIFEDEEAKP